MHITKAAAIEALQNFFDEHVLVDDARQRVADFAVVYEDSETRVKVEFYDPHAIDESEDDNG